MSTTDPVACLLAALKNVKKNGTGYTAHCPGHDDRHSSLSIGAGADGRALVKCHAGCETPHIVASMGLEMSDLFPPRPEALRGNGGSRRTGGRGEVNPPKHHCTSATRRSHREAVR